MRAAMAVIELHLNWPGRTTQHADTAMRQNCTAKCSTRARITHSRGGIWPLFATLVPIAKRSFSRGG